RGATGWPCGERSGKQHDEEERRSGKAAHVPSSLDRTPNTQGSIVVKPRTLEGAGFRSGAKVAERTANVCFGSKRTFRSAIDMSVSPQNRHSNSGIGMSATAQKRTKWCALKRL